MRERSRLESLLELIGSTIALAAAVESGRKPRNRDLGVLGIDAGQFHSIRRF